MKEIWKDIPDYIGIYQVSNLGQVKSLDRTITKGNNFTQKCKGKILSKWINGRGYANTVLWKDGTQKTFRIHRLVCIMFLENPLDKEQVNHKDGNKLNNCVDNLEWCTNLENIRHAYKTGLKTGNLGTINGSSKLTEEEVISIRNSSKSSETLAYLYKVNTSTITRIKSRKLWKHIS